MRNAVLAVCALASGAAQATCLRFFGNGAGDYDRVKVRLDAPSMPVDVGAGAFTVEWWIRAELSENTGVAQYGGDGWIFGNIVIDRDVYGPGDFGDFGVSLSSGRVAFGVATQAWGHTVIGSRPVCTGQWHHVAVQREAGGELSVWVDGVLDVREAGPPGRVDYRDFRPTSWPLSDPFLVIGAEKHDAGAAFPSYSGKFAEMRVSSVARYSLPFRRPRSRFVPDSATAALYRCDEGAGSVLHDSSGAPGGPSDGEVRYGGSPFGPVWSPDGPPLLQTAGPRRP
jgi:hypothetical protein